jgi:HptB-dependent secretion and biofilm anti anti-sigma factor
MPADDDLSIVLGEFEELRVVTLRGDWDVANRQQLREALTELGTASDVLVDLREASFFDSTALAELIALYKRLNGGGRRLEALVGGSNMRRLLELTSLDGLIGVSAERAQYLNERLPPPAWPLQD